MPLTAADASAATADTYLDFSGLQSLKRGAATHDPAAVRKVAQQFEAMFTRMMLKSMRDAVGTDPIFGSDQEKTYQGMYDDQLALQLSRGRGLGLADMLIRQLQRMGVPGTGASGKAGQAGAAAGGPAVRGLQGALGGGAAGAVLRGRNAAAAGAIQGRGAAGANAARPMPPVSKADQMSFIQDLWPEAQQAGSQLGVDPRNLIAQAALETHWGRSMPGGSSGHSSNNLFGVKASGSWNADEVSAVTTEYSGGTPQAVTAPFRAYADDSQSFQDYVALLRGNPRYAAALNTGSDSQAFATGLAHGGYATDPDYARKLGSIVNNIAGTLAMSLRNLPGLKSITNLPTTVGTGVL